MEKNIKKSVFSKIRNYFITGIVVLIPIGITLYLTLFFIRVSGKVIPNEINPNNYLPFNIPGLEILIALLFITLITQLPTVPGLFLILLKFKSVSWFLATENDSLVS